MIQRIQTVYLSLAFIAIAVLFAFPLAEFFDQIGINGTYILSITGLKNQVPPLPGEVEVFNSYLFLPLPIAAIGLAMLLLVTVFQYKNRQLQVKLTNIGVFISISLILSIFFLYVPMIEKKINIVPNYLDCFGIYMPLVTLVFIVMANRAIKRDEKLVRSADRLR